MHERHRRGSEVKMTLGSYNADSNPVEVTDVQFVKPKPEDLSHLPGDVLTPNYEIRAESDDHVTEPLPEMAEARTMREGFIRWKPTGRLYAGPVFPDVAVIGNVEAKLLWCRTEFTTTDSTAFAEVMAGRWFDRHLPDDAVVRLINSRTRTLLFAGGLNRQRTEMEPVAPGADLHHYKLVIDGQAPYHALDGLSEGEVK